MDKEVYVALLIDDHPIIRSSYKEAAKLVANTLEGVSFIFEEAGNCDEAISKVNVLAKSGVKNCLVFLDISLPASKDKSIVSGEDLGIWINKKLPQSKIIVSTAFNDNYRIHNILKNLNPDGFLVKNDTTPKELINAISDIVSDPPYYSKTVLKLLRKESSNDYLLDEIDRKLLYELSQGTLMKELPDILHLSMAGVEKRKRQLKLIFDVESTSDRELLSIARVKGFI
ncbi:response regulator [Zhouia amylolytica]|uniref:Two-component system response regulator n=1 Tax=Zhouia amylolytica AD3 TaxID=1286632 RepID=W2US36_9FLAO|nr:response regulator transcription factor [Zhouia amylolytica]ETN96152.1 two-component system response regulator [Zhouia amylolytica AD3]